ncbi:MAG: SPASM domain-containing protein [Candidatus Omnitrophica bacterium]|nr:SPASM domain-containing protein [Candidatus Omnitrophota bacterium]
MTMLRRTTKAAKLLVIRPRGWKSAITNQLAAYMGRTRAPFAPTLAVIEVSALCSLACPVCETGAGKLGREQSLMSLEVFRTVIDRISRHINTVFLYWMGEPFLNPEIYGMISYARSKNIYVAVCTNGEQMDTEALLEAGPDEVQFQVAGTSQKAHERYRVGSTLRNVETNIGRLAGGKKEHGKKRPRILAGLIVTKYSEKEAHAFDGWARALGADGSMLIDLWVRDYDQAVEFLPEDRKYWLYDPLAFEAKELKLKDGTGGKCYSVWHMVTVNWKGEVFPCCRDTANRYRMGDLLKDPLEKIWNSREYMEFRRKVLPGHFGPDLCRLCPSFGVPNLGSVDTGDGK